MILQVGGLAVGAISIKSRPLSSAIRKASGTPNTPSILPSSSITRTSGARISRLTLKPSLSPRFGRSPPPPLANGRLPPPPLGLLLGPAPPPKPLGRLPPGLKPPPPPGGRPLLN